MMGRYDYLSPKELARLVQQPSSIKNKVAQKTSQKKRRSVQRRKGGKRK